MRMEKIVVQQAALKEATSGMDSKFVFCSSNHVHFDWLNRALNEWRLKQQELAPIDALASRLIACRPQLLLLDFSGNCGSDRQNCTDEMIALAKRLKNTLPDLHVVAVGTMDYPDGALAALRAGVHHFIDMHADEEEARAVIRTLIAPPDAQANLDPCTLVALVGARTGIGTTTFAVHLADLLQQRKTLQKTEHRIGLLDLGLPSGDGQLYLNVAGTFNFIDAIRNRHRLDQTLIQTAMSHNRNGVKVVSLPRSQDDITHIPVVDAVALLAQLRPYFDVLIVDLGGFPDSRFVIDLAHAADQTWFITDQSVGSLVSLAALLKEFEAEGESQKRHLIVNRYDVRYGMDAEQIAERFKLPLKAVLPECALRMLSTANLGKLLHEVTRSDPYIRTVQSLGDSLLKSNIDRRSSGSKIRSKMPGWIQRCLPMTKKTRGPSK